MAYVICYFASALVYTEVWYRSLVSLRLARASSEATMLIKGPCLVYRQCLYPTLKPQLSRPGGFSILKTRDSGDFFVSFPEISFVIIHASEKECTTRNQLRSLTQDSSKQLL